MVEIGYDALGVRKPNRNTRTPLMTSKYTEMTSRKNKFTESGS